MKDKINKASNLTHV